MNWKGEHPELWLAIFIKNPRKVNIIIPIATNLRIVILFPFSESEIIIASKNILTDVSGKATRARNIEFANAFATTEPTRKVRE